MSLLVEKNLMFPHNGMHSLYNLPQNMVNVHVYGTKWWFSGAAYFTPIAFPVSVMIVIPVVFVRPESNRRKDSKVISHGGTEARRKGL